MKNLFNNSVVRSVRGEVNDRLRRPNDPRTQQGSSSLSNSSGPPRYYHQPASSSSSTTDSYSHTANSTAGYSLNNTYPKLPNNQERERQSFLGKVESTATNLLGSVVGEDAVVSATHSLNAAVTSGRHARDVLRNGTIVQLVSKSSGRLLQVVMSSAGVLVFDGDGAGSSFNTYFTVEEREKGRVRFHNNCNYLAFDGKQPCIISFPPGPRNNSSIEFRVHDILGSNELLAFESCAYKGCYISITSDGHLKTTNIKDKNIDAQFSVTFVSDFPQSTFPYQPQPPRQVDKQPYGGLPPNDASQYTASAPPMYTEQPSAPPPPYSTIDPYSQSSASSSLYPKFN